MEFYEYAQMLYPCLGDGKIPPEFMTTLIVNIMEDVDKSKCPLLDAKPEYLRRIYNGAKTISSENATFVNSNLNKGRFIDFICEFPIDTLQRVASILRVNGIKTDGTDMDVAEKCANTLEEIFFNIASGGNMVQGKVEDIGAKKGTLESLDNLEQLLASFPKPKELLPPNEIKDHEQPYITELYGAYGDAEGIKNFDNTMLLRFCDYEDDLNDRRIDYFAAEAIRCETSELFGGKYADQFDTLKKETYAGVKNTARKTFNNGYERLLAVMEQSSVIRVDRYWLSRSPHWISNNIKMGICHFLVGDGKLKWVKRND